MTAAATRTKTETHTRRRLWLLPLEPMAERYTGQWYRWLPETFGKDFEVAVIDGVPLTSGIGHGAFLDTTSSAHYKATQMASVARLFRDGAVKAGDLFWFSDLEFPGGPEQVRYLARLFGIEVLIAGFLHAASYTREDAMAVMAGDCGPNAERTWIAAADMVFLGTNYHLGVLMAERLEPGAAPQRYREHLRDGGKPAFAYLDDDLFERASTWGSTALVVTGNPFRSAELWRERARYMEARGLAGEHAAPLDAILYPHRPDREKRPVAALTWLGEVLEKHAGPMSSTEAGRRGAAIITTGRRTYRSTNEFGLPERITALVTRYGGHRVMLHTDVGPAELAFHAARSRYVLSTAIEENFGYAMTEAVALGATPIYPRGYAYEELFAPHGIGVAYGTRAEWHEDPRPTDARVVELLRHLTDGLFPGLPTRATRPRTPDDLRSEVQRLVARLDGAEDRIRRSLVALRRWWEKEREGA